MTYNEYVNEVVKLLGGVKNINSVTHCATRLRFMLNDKTKVNKDKIESLELTIGVVEAQGTFQVVIGPNVGDVFEELVKIKGIHSDGEVVEETNSTGEKAGLFDRFLGTISAIFTPYIPVLASAGIIKGLLALSVNAGWLTESANTYAILSAAGNSLIYFFPILLAYTSAKKFGANPYIGAVIGAALMEPNLTAINVTGSSLSFLGIPFVGQAFENTVIPIILGMWAYSYLEKFLKKHLPKAVQMMLVPLICLLVMVPAILLVFGPIGFFFANLIAKGYQALLTFGPIPMSLLFGGFFIYVIMLGMHWVVLPIELSILASQGFEYSLCAGGMGNYALLGICLALFFVSKDKQTKIMAGSAAFVNGLSGITEPGLYGIAVKNKRYFAIITISGLIGGFILGVSNCYVTAFAFSGLLGLPAFMASPTAPMYFVAVITVIAVSFVLTVIMEKRAEAKKA